MIIAAAACVVTTVLVFISRITASGTSLVLAIAAAVLNLICSFLNFTLGSSATGGKKSRRQVKGGFRLGIISIILFVIGMLIAAANGIIIVHLVILTVCGLIIPCFYLIACQIKR